MRNGSLLSNSFWERGNFSHSFNNQRLQLKPFTMYLLAHNGMQQGRFSFLFRWPMELKFLQVCYFMHTLGYNNWEYVSSAFKWPDCYMHDIDHFTLKHRKTLHLFPMFQRMLYLIIRYNKMVNMLPYVSSISNQYSQSKLRLELEFFCQNL